MGSEVGAGSIHPGKWIARLALPGLAFEHQRPSLPISNNGSPGHIRASKIVGTFMQTTHQKLKLLQPEKARVLQKFLDATIAMHEDWHTPIAPDLRIALWAVADNLLFRFRGFR